ncbi:poly-gamma-glutamate biosynthesis protein PgsC [SCandidatus Aminicenantes bacterium Aminicenantia_JdfR_composite]|jgi:poly-gamma-glutamate biosynthesis protein PgsC/CapC|nr:poly-gamma-glutamate biosynthesis protein PgsC [SCandidatus Aminicenantes bacterium Aminicenantia_JdfR_composite]
MFFETFLIGILIAVLYIEIFDIYPGGIIVPAYIALYLEEPLRILITISIALLSLLTYKFLSKFLILFGKRRFVMIILLGTIWSQILSLLFPYFHINSIELKAIGWLIPGLLANNLERQDIILTLASMFTVSIFTYFLVKIIFLL